MRSNVTWDTFDDVRVDRSSSLVDVGRQSEVKLKTIRWRDVHELRVKGADQLILPPTTEKCVRRAGFEEGETNLEGHRSLTGVGWVHTPR